MIEIYNDLGDRFQGLYEDLQRGVQAGSPLLSLTKMMNLPTDVVNRMSRNHAAQAYLKDLLDKELHANPDGIHCQHPTKDHTSFFDTVPILIDQMHVQYLPALDHVHQAVEPGHLVYITGKAGTGKT